LNDLEKQCKLNITKLDKINLDELKNRQMPKWVHKLRTPDIEQQEITEVLTKLNTNILELPIKILKYQSDLILNKSLGFQSIDGKSFGKLIVNENAVIVTNNQIALTSPSSTTTIKSTFGNCVRTFSGHTKSVRCVRIFDNARDSSTRLVSASDDFNIKLWGLESGKCEKTLRGHTDCVGSLLITRNARLISGSFDATIRVWDLKSFKCIHVLREECKVICLCIISNSQFASACVDGTVNVWDLTNYSKNCSFKAHEKSILCVRLSNDLNMVL
jgi:WD40 repeat protein